MDFSHDLLRLLIDMRRYMTLAQEAILSGRRMLRFGVTRENREAVRALLRNLRRLISEPGWSGPSLRWIEIDCGHWSIRTPHGLATFLEQAFQIPTHYETSSGSIDPIDLGSDEPALENISVLDLAQGRATIGADAWEMPAETEPDNKRAERQLREKTQRLLASVARRVLTDPRPIIVLQYPELLTTPAWNWYWDKFWTPLMSLDPRLIPQLIYQGGLHCDLSGRQSPPPSDFDIEVMPVIHDSADRAQAERDIVKLIVNHTGWSEDRAREIARDIMRGAGNNLSLIPMGIIGRLQTLEV